MQNYYGWPPPPPHWFGQQQAPQGPQQPNVIYVPIKMGKNGKAPKAKNIAEQLKDMFELGDVLEKKFKKEEKKEDGSFKMYPITFLMWLLALSIPVGALQLFAIYLPIAKMASNALK